MADDGTVVKVNVGGTIYMTQLGTLRAHPGSILATMFTPPYGVHQDARDGSFFLDRNGSCFGAILDYLRTGTLVVPRDPTEYVVLRREVHFYGLPIAVKLPQAQPLAWEAAPVRYRHARVVFEEIEKTIEWEEGALPLDLHRKTMFEIVTFFTGRGYKVVSEYTSRGTKGYVSLWLAKKETYPGADVAVEVSMDTAIPGLGEPSGLAGSPLPTGASPMGRGASPPGRVGGPPLIARPQPGPGPAPRLASAQQARPGLAAAPAPRPVARGAVPGQAGAPAYMSGVGGGGASQFAY